MAENFKFLHAKNIQRPQLQFKTKIDNSSTPFIPKLKCKPNALVPLPKGMVYTSFTVNILISWMNFVKVRCNTALLS